MQYCFKSGLASEELLSVENEVWSYKGNVCFLLYQDNPEYSLTDLALALVFNLPFVALCNDSVHILIINYDWIIHVLWEFNALEMSVTISWGNVAEGVQNARQQGPHFQTVRSCFIKDFTDPKNTLFLELRVNVWNMSILLQGLLDSGLLICIACSLWFFYYRLVFFEGVMCAISLVHYRVHRYIRYRWTSVFIFLVDLAWSGFWL